VDERLSHQLDEWLRGDEEKTVDSLIDLFGSKSFAILFVLLLAVPALPLPTGGITHLLELIAMLVALQLIANRKKIWLPQRWCGIVIAGERQTRLIGSLMKLVRRPERVSRPRLAFLSPPFSGLDTLPAVGVVLLSLGVLLEDIAIVLAGVAIGAAGVALEIVLGRAAVHAIGNLL
jgi:hypothetical protein